MDSASDDEGGSGELIDPSVLPAILEELRRAPKIEESDVEEPEIL